MPDISLIIPARNEQDNVKPLMESISAHMAGFDYEVIIIDDSDDDRTIIQAVKNGARVIVGHHKGLAQAVIDGIDGSSGEYIIVMDADLQHPPKFLPEVICQLYYHDLVVVTKHTQESMSELSFKRKLQSNLGVWASSFLIPAPVSDPMTGFFGIRRKCLEGIPRGEYYRGEDGSKPTKYIGIEGIGFKIGLELFVKAKWVSHAEVPMYFKNREFGMSKGTRHSLQKHLWRLFKNSHNYEVELPKGGEEYFAFYEGTEWQAKWKQDIANKLHEITEIIKPKKLLDAACGGSPNINYMSGERVGVDINEKALEYMRSHSDATFVSGSVLDIPFPDSSFDMVTCIEFLEHLYPEDIDKALSELVRVLEPKGYLVLATPNYSSILWNVIEKSQQLVQKGAWTSDHHTKFNRKSLGELCSKYDLEELQYDGVMSNMDMVITYGKS